MTINTFKLAIQVAVYAYMKEKNKIKFIGNITKVYEKDIKTILNTINMDGNFLHFTDKKKVVKGAFKKLSTFINESGFSESAFLEYLKLDVSVLTEAEKDNILALCFDVILIDRIVSSFEKELIAQVVHIRYSKCFY